MHQNRGGAEGSTGLFGQLEPKGRSVQAADAAKKQSRESLLPGLKRTMLRLFPAPVVAAPATSSFQRGVEEEVQETDWGSFELGGAALWMLIPCEARSPQRTCQRDSFLLTVTPECKGITLRQWSFICFGASETLLRIPKKMAILPRKRRVPNRGRVCGLTSGCLWHPWGLSVNPEELMGC